MHEGTRSYHLLHLDMEVSHHLLLPQLRRLSLEERQFLTLPELPLVQDQWVDSKVAPILIHTLKAIHIFKVVLPIQLDRQVKALD